MIHNQGKQLVDLASLVLEMTVFAPYFARSLPIACISAPPHKIIVKPRYAITLWGKINECGNYDET